MKKKLSASTIAAGIMLLVIGLWVLPVTILGIRSNVIYFEGSLNVIVSTLILFFVGIVSILQIILAIYLFKKRRWAHIFSVVLVIAMMLSSLFQSENNYSVTPAYLSILILLMLGAKDFKKA